MNKKCLNVVLISIVLASSCLVNVANAGYIVNGGKDNFIDNGVITTEYRADGTVWEWLDLTVTNGISYNSIIADLADDNTLNNSVSFFAVPGVLLDIQGLSALQAQGWATTAREDVVTMINNFFNTSFNEAFTSIGIPLAPIALDIELFIEMFGDTYHEGNDDYNVSLTDANTALPNIGFALGITSTHRPPLSFGPQYPQNYTVAVADFQYISSQLDQDDMIGSQGTNDLTTNRPEYGTWLTREVFLVSEPSTIVVFSLALFGLIVSRIRRLVR